MGGQRATARALGVTQPTVLRWVRGHCPISAEFVLRVEEASGISRHLLRPDIYPADLGPSPAWKPVWMGVDLGQSPVSCERSSVLQFAQPFEGRNPKATEADGAASVVGGGLAA